MRALKKMLVMLPVAAPIFAILIATPVARPAQAQSIVCCNQNISVGGNWVGSGRLQDCQGYFNNAPHSILRRMCQQREAFSCINTERCSELPPEETAAPDPTSSDAALPPDVDRDGLEQGFYGTPPPLPPVPARPPRMPHRLAYLLKWSGDGKPVKSFTVWLDHKGCPLPLDKNNRLTDSTAARHVVRGKVIHHDGRVTIEAEAQRRPGGAKLGPYTGEADGEGAAAVAIATRAMIEKMKLVCVR
jgi:hypothetical protein